MSQLVTCCYRLVDLVIVSFVDLIPIDFNVVLVTLFGEDIKVVTARLGQDAVDKICLRPNYVGF